MPKKCRIALQRLIFVLSSFVYLALRKTIVTASCQIMPSSSLFRVIIVITGHFSPHEDNTKETRSCPIVTERQHDFVKPSQWRHSSAMTWRWDNGIDEDRRIWVAQAFPMYHSNVDVKASLRVSSSVNPVEQLCRASVCVTLKLQSQLITIPFLQKCEVAITPH